MTAQHSPTTQWRKRRAALGFVRVEVEVRKEDAPLIRAMATALGDPARNAGVRERLRAELLGEPGRRFKHLLESAPLEGIELDRQKDIGRDVDL